MSKTIQVVRKDASGREQVCDPIHSTGAARGIAPDGPVKCPKRPSRHRGHDDGSDMVGSANVQKMGKKVRRQQQTPWGVPIK